MALLRALLAIRPLNATGKIYAGHVNHQLRPAADREARQLAAWCRQSGCPLHVRTAAPGELAAIEGDGLEAAARTVRYRLLTEMAHQLGARHVVTAHHQDDQVETVLFRLLRGTGLSGLRGMPRVRALSETVTLVRPLLEVPRAVVRDYLAVLQQPSCDDASNRELTFKRNRLRQELLPYLREHFNSDVDGALLRVARQSADACGAIQTLVDPIIERLVPRWVPSAATQVQIEAESRPKARWLQLEAHELASTSDYLLCEAVRTVWRRFGLPMQQMDARWWQHLAEMLRSATDSVPPLNLPGNLQARREEQQVVIGPVVIGPVEPTPGP
jgi:tRNA(Ile)-lysidine synthase